MKRTNIISALKKVTAAAPAWNIYYEGDNEKEELFGTVYSKEELESTLKKLKEKYPDLEFMVKEVKDIRHEKLVQKLKTPKAIKDFLKENPDDKGLLTENQIEILFASEEVQDINKDMLNDLIDKAGTHVIGTEVMKRVKDLSNSAFLGVLDRMIGNKEILNVMDCSEELLDRIKNKSNLNLEKYARIVLWLGVTSDEKEWVNDFLPKLDKLGIEIIRYRERESIEDLFDVASEDNRTLDIFFRNTRHADLKVIPIVSYQTRCTSLDTSIKIIKKAFEFEKTRPNPQFVDLLNWAAQIEKKNLVNEILDEMKNQWNEKSPWFLSNAKNRLHVSTLFEYANAENQKLNIFYDSIFERFFESEEDEDEDEEESESEYYHRLELIAKDYVKSAKDKDFIFKRLAEEFPSLDWSDADFEFWAKTPLWKSVAPSGDKTNLLKWYESLSAEQKKEVYSQDRQHMINKLDEVLAEHEPKFEDVCLELWTDDSQDKYWAQDSYKILRLYGATSEKIIKGILDRKGPIYVLGCFLSFQYFGNLEDLLNLFKKFVKLDSLDVDEVTTQFKNLGFAESAISEFYLMVDRYDLLDEKTLLKIIGKLSDEELLKIGNKLGVSRVLVEIVEEPDLRKKFTKFFMQADITPEQTILMFNLYTKGENWLDEFDDFIFAFGDQLSNDDWKAFTPYLDDKSVTIMIKIRVYSLTAPKKVIQIIQDLFNNATPVSKFTYASIKNLDPRYIKEFVLRNVAAIKLGGKQSQRNLINICVSFLPDSYLDSSLAPIYYDENIPFEQKKVYLDKMGDALDPEQIRKIIGKDKKNYPRYERPRDVEELPHKAIDEKGELLKLLLPLAKERKAKAKLIVTPDTKKMPLSVKEMLQLSMKDIPDDYVISFDDVKKTYPSLADKLKELLFKAKKTLTVKELKLIVMDLDLEDNKFWLSEVPYSGSWQKKLDMDQVVIQYNFTESMIAEIKKCPPVHSYLTKVFAEKEGTAHPLSNQSFAWARVYKFLKLWLIEELQTDFVGWDTNFKSMTQSMETIMKSFSEQEQKEIKDFISKHFLGWEKKFLATIVQMARDQKIPQICLFDMSEKQGQQTSPSKLKWYYQTLPKSLGFKNTNDEGLPMQVSYGDKKFKIWLKDL